MSIVLPDQFSPSLSHHPSHPTHQSISLGPVPGAGSGPPGPISGSSNSAPINTVSVTGGPPPGGAIQSSASSHPPSRIMPVSGPHSNYQRAGNGPGNGPGQGPQQPPTPNIPSGPGSNASAGPSQGPSSSNPNGSLAPLLPPSSTNGGPPATLPPPATTTLPPSMSGTLPSSSSDVGDYATGPLGGPIVDLSVDPNTVPPDLKREGTDWFAIFNPLASKDGKKRTLDVSLVHTLLHERSVCFQRSV